MSLESWKAEFYPVEASEVSVKDALAHSKRKWEGLRRENLERHGLELEGGGLVAASSVGTLFFIASDSCALCHYFLEKSKGDYYQRCTNCPLRMVRGEPCDAPSHNPPSPWGSFIRENDPLPMIALIDEAIAASSTEGVKS